MRSSAFLPAGLATLMLLGAGCGDKDPEAGTVTPEQAATRLEEAFPEESTTEPVHVGIQSASEALREGNYEKAVVALEVTRQTPTPLTFEQGMAVQSSLITLEHRLIEAIANGDPNAQRAYDLLKKSKRN